MVVDKTPINLLPADDYTLTVADKARFADEEALGIVPPTHPVLRSTAASVDESQITSEEIQQIVQKLFDTANGQRDGKHASKRKGRGMVGLAAPQIGVAKRIILVDRQVGEGRKAFGKLECFINPQIVWRSRETVLGREGCFSAGPVWGVVRRSVAVKIRAFTPDGRQIEHIFENFTARIVQHEIDHLDGVRFPERIRSDACRHWVHAEELETYAKRYKSWPRHCTLNRWRTYSGLGGNPDL
ncbi:MAG TPA: peptide deformylase [Candidatus Saccharimonadales bacterium]